MTRKEWYTSLFDELNQYWAEIADARSAEDEVEFIENIVQTSGLVLDLCCGTGRHSILLSGRGWDMVGLDISPNLLRIAKKRMEDKGVGFLLVRGEMRHLPFQPETFAAVINMFTSFGYLPSEREDIESLKEVARILRQSGLLVIDVANREHLMHTFRKKDWGEFSSFYMLEKRTLDIEKSRLHSQWTLLDKATDKTRTFEHNLRLYSLPQLDRLLKRAGLPVEQVYGDYERQEFLQDSSRMIILAKKQIAFIK